MIEPAGINRDQVPPVERIEPLSWSDRRWDVCSAMKQRTEYVVESVIRPKGERQNREDETSEQERFFHVICFRAVLHAIRLGNHKNFPD
jgi:hypothetical protein